ncbi:MAG: hypothetical protein DI628_01740 [Blastochloris viridis]|uniref:glutathione-specific gamma-glutamylcyclotransferase n=1 Tax=Blastochloris viridis TaxID=1079 RepID=A0A6N4R2R4_BLAVI|nr:MAG: hypothetical protein DI628_01740 [Blastochloris viridis]
MNTDLILPHRPQAELETSLDKTLKDKSDLHRGVWVFVYGLLAYNPPFKYVSCQPQVLQGWQRRFNLADPHNRGTPSSPGLTLGLEQEGECHGVSYLLSAVEAHEALRKIWEQEMLLPFYIPTWMDIEGRSQLVMMTDPASPALTHPGPQETLYVIATAKGKAGTNQAYLENVIDAFRRFGIEDAYLKDIQNRL